MLFLKKRKIVDTGRELDGSVVVKNASLHYGEHRILHDVSVELPAHRITALIGPSGCGKSSFLRCLNRMNDPIPGCRVEGEFLVGGVNAYTELEPMRLRRHVGMVFQKPNPFPMSIFENVAYGLRAAGVRRRDVLEAAVEDSLRRAAMWEELSGRLHTSAQALSGGQQQRLCIARALAVQPGILLLDEPTSALDPISTAAIEELCRSLAETTTILIVTHNLAQAKRLSHKTAFFLSGELVEFGDTPALFDAPRDPRTARYLAGGG